MENSIYTDDVLWDTYVDAQFDSVLEEEMDSLLRQMLTWFADIVGDCRIAAAFGFEERSEAAEQSAGSPAPTALIEKILDAQRGHDTFSLDATQAHARSYFLKTFALLGTVERRSDIGLAAIETLVNWGDRVRSMPGAGSLAPVFEVVSRAARARLDLDTGRGADMDDFVCLLAIARWPIGEPLSPAILDLPKKTVQNLVSSKTIARDLAGRLEQKSAMTWISEQFAFTYLFPSADIAAARKKASPRPPLKDPVFVPQVRCDQTMAVEPYLPDFLGPDGYEILNGSERHVTGDYFEALRILSSIPRAQIRAMAAPGQTFLATSLGTFMAIERGQLISLIPASAQVIEPSPVYAEAFPHSVGKALQSVPSVSVFPKGHTKKLLRFVSSKWGPIAVEPLRSSVNVYMADTSQNRESFGAFITSATGPGPTGRHSNLDTIPGFKGHSLIVMALINASEAERLLKAIAG